MDTNWTTAKIKEFCDKYPIKAIGVDATGIGASVVDNLVGYKNANGLAPEVIPLHFGAQAKNQEKFTNLKAEIFWYMRSLFEDGELSISDEGNALGDLSALRYSYDGKQRIIMEKKAKVKSRGLPSPDFADALQTLSNSLFPLPYRCTF